ncbi:unnamed protein product [Anisakis simplex]|uniref:Secreted protein n=1 Tax=Anisakis simplex TaxID=6269 RepID=A0A0M3JFV5_ANISI|nr:unnamed protein product [Anisakis simplex]
MIQNWVCEWVWFMGLGCGQWIDRYICWNRIRSEQEWREQKMTQLMAQPPHAPELNEVGVYCCLALNSYRSLLRCTDSESVSGYYLRLVSGYFSG